MKRRTLVAAAGILAIAGSIPLSALAAEKTIVVGVTAGPHAEIMEVVKRIAEKQGMKIRIVEFNDFVQPNAALVAGDLDINSFQHKPYMDQQNEDRGYKLASAAAINASYAEPAGLTPAKDGIAQERPDGPYANILCVRAEDLSKPWVAKFVQCYHSPEVKAFVEKRFNGGMICAW